MSEQATIEKNEKGWIIEFPDEFAEEIGVEKKSIGLLEYKNGKIEIELLPPPSPEIELISERLGKKYEQYFEEMKRLGD